MTFTARGFGLELQSGRYIFLSSTGLNVIKRNPVVCIKIYTFRPSGSNAVTAARSDEGNSIAIACEAKYYVVSRVILRLGIL